MTGLFRDAPDPPSARSRPTKAEWNTRAFGVHSCCRLHARAVTQFMTRLATSLPAPIASGWSVAAWGLKRARLCTAHAESRYSLVLLIGYWVPPPEKVVELRLRPTPRSADRARSLARVSGKREYFKCRPETIGDFALRLLKFGA